MRKQVSILAAVLLTASCLLTGCGGSSPAPTGEASKSETAAPAEVNEQDIENALEQLDAEDTQTAETTAPQEESYEPLPEIINADIRDGLVQVYDDIFRAGGYYTISDIITKYGDKYDFSAVNPDGYTTDEQYIVEVPRLNSKYKLRITAFNPAYRPGSEGEKQTHLSDLVAVWFNGENDFNWFSYYSLNEQYAALTFDDVKPFLENLGLKYLDINTIVREYTEPKGISNIAELYGYNEQGQFYSATMILKEKNLFGSRPIENIIFYTDMENNKATYITVNPLISLAHYWSEDDGSKHGERKCWYDPDCNLVDSLP